MEALSELKQGLKELEDIARQMLKTKLSFEKIKEENIIVLYQKIKHAQETAEFIEIPYTE